MTDGSDEDAVSVALGSMSFAIAYRTACSRRSWIEARYVRPAGSAIRKKKPEYNTDLSDLSNESGHDNIALERVHHYECLGYEVHREVEICDRRAVPIRGKIDIVAVSASEVVFEEVKATAYDHQTGFTQVKLYAAFAKKGCIVDEALRATIASKHIWTLSYFSGANEIGRSAVQHLSEKERRKFSDAYDVIQMQGRPATKPSKRNCSFCIADAWLCQDKIVDERS